MTGTSASPGPFHVFHSNGVIEIHSKNFGTVVKWTGFDGTDFNHEKNLSNAYLLAAAPELLEALKYARRFLKPEHHDCEFVDAAIAKATGGQQ